MIGSAVVQQYSRRVPHLLVGPHPRGGFVVQDIRTGETVHALDQAALESFAAARSSARGYHGLGDAVHALTRAVGIKKPCTPCAKRQAQLNGLVPRLWRR